MIQALHIVTVAALVVAAYGLLILAWQIVLYCLEARRDARAMHRYRQAKARLMIEALDNGASLDVFREDVR